MVGSEEVGLAKVVAEADSDSVADWDLDFVVKAVGWAEGSKSIHLKQLGLPST